MNKMENYIVTTDNAYCGKYVYGINAENDNAAFNVFKESLYYLKNEPYKVVDRGKGLYQIYSAMLGTVFVSVFKFTSFNVFKED